MISEELIPGEAESVDDVRAALFGLILNLRVAGEDKSSELAEAGRRYAACLRPFADGRRELRLERREAVVQETFGSLVILEETLRDSCSSCPGCSSFDAECFLGVFNR